MVKKNSTQCRDVSEGNEGRLKVKVAHSAQDWRRAKEALGREHGLGAGSEAGDRLCQLVMEDGKLAGVLVWCAAAWHLKDRDEAVGWDAVTRSERLKLVVQLRRFFWCAPGKPAATWVKVPPVELGGSRPKEMSGKRP